MSTAIISDIHGNAVALEAVLQDIASREEVQRIVCLGDIIGYGPEPLQCVDLVAEKCEWSLMGNHDFGVLYEPTNFNPTAESAAYWTRECFDAEEDEESRNRRYGFLGKLRVRVVEAAGVATSRSLLAVHGSPRKPINEYIFPDDALNSPEKMRQVFDLVEGIAIVGHTHVPGIFTDEPDFYPPSEIGDGDRYKFIEDEKAIVNVGSVGQPRDLDPRASYAVIDDESVSFHRVEYNIDETAEKIREVPELNDWLADRLYEGR